MQEFSDNIYSGFLRTSALSRDFDLSKSACVKKLKVDRAI